MASAKNQTPAEPEVDQSLFPSAADLQEAEDMWAGGAEEAAKSRPVGPLVCEITEAELQRASSSGRLQIWYRLKIITPIASKDVEVDKFDGLGSPQQASITQGQLKRLGVDTTKCTLKTLPGYLVELKGKKVNAAAKMNGEFYNINIQKVLVDSVTDTAKSGSVARPGARPAGRKF